VKSTAKTAPKPVSAKAEISPKSGKKVAEKKVVTKKAVVKKPTKK